MQQGCESSIGIGYARHLASLGFGVIFVDADSVLLDEAHQSLSDVTTRIELIRLVSDSSCPTSTIAAFKKIESHLYSKHIGILSE